MAKAVFGAGCFWGVEKKFSEVKGVTSTEVGYSQGKNSKTSYEEVCTGTTDHVEVVLVEFEEDQVSYENLVHLFYDLHDPTTLNQQGPDRGTQYRSLLGYYDESQKTVAETTTEKLNLATEGSLPEVMLTASTSSGVVVFMVSATIATRPSRRLSVRR